MMSEILRNHTEAKAVRVPKLEMVSADLPDDLGEKLRDPSGRLSQNIFQAAAELGLTPVGNPVGPVRPIGESIHRALADKQSR